MAESEIIILIVSAIIGLFFWGQWYWIIHRVNPLASGPQYRWPLQWTPPICIAAFYAVVQKFASWDVIGSLAYTTFYLVFAAAWVGALRPLLGFCGVSWRDDVLERANTAAVMPVAAGLFALTLCFTGGNIGDGPGWWVVFFAAGMATVALIVCWQILELVCHNHEIITIDRDVDCGLRLAGWLVAMGLLFGCGAAGDWVSVEATIDDFVPYAIAGFVMMIAYMILEAFIRPHGIVREKGEFLWGTLPALAYITSALIWLASIGWWKQ